MKKILTVLVTFLALASVVLCFVAPAGAQSLIGPGSDVCNQSGNQSPACDPNVNGSNPLTGQGGILMKVTQIIALIAGITSIILFVIAGIKYSTSGGDPSKLASAKDTIIYASVGLIITAAAESIVIFVLNKL